MATANKKLLTRDAITTAFTFTSLSTSGVDFTYDCNDETSAFVVYNTGGSAGDITVVADGKHNKQNITLSAPVGYSFFAVNSRFFKNTNGEVKLKGASSLTVALVVLP